MIVLIPKDMNLRSLNPALWPGSAQKLAYEIIKRQRAEFDGQLDKQDWLVAQVERKDQSNKRLEAWFTRVQEGGEW